MHFAFVCSLFLIDTKAVWCYELATIRLKIIKGAKINRLELTMYLSESRQSMHIDCFGYRTGADKPMLFWFTNN